MTLGAFPLVAHVLKLEWDKAASYPACQVLTAHDARYASLKRNERAQSTNGLRAPRASTGARRSKVEGVLKSFGYSLAKSSYKVGQHQNGWR